MDSLISHLIKNPTWVPFSAFISLFLLGILTLFTFSQAYEDEKNENKKNNKLSIKYIFYFAGIMFFMFVPIMLLFQEPNAYQKIIKNKEYTLTKNNKILTISSKNEFLPSTDLEIIYEDDETMQVKLDNDLYTIDKKVEKINGN